MGHVQAEESNDSGARAPHFEALRINFTRSDHMYGQFIYKQKSLPRRSRGCVSGGSLYFVEFHPLKNESLTRGWAKTMEVLGS